MIDTARLILRPWREADRAPFLAMCQSPAVMRHLGDPLDQEQVDAAIARMDGYQAAHGYCFWAIERRADAAFLGFCGLKPGTIGTIAGEIEIGWRLREDAWGQGYAKEAALASLDWGWAHLDAPRIAAITVPANTASWGLMERVGMVRRPEMDFGHSAFTEDHPLHRHIAYTIDRPQG